jgi:chromosome segregation ATPase
LDTAYGELSELQFSSDQDKVALEAAVAAAETRAREAETAAAAAAAAAEAQMQDTSAVEAATARLQEVQAERDQALAAAEALQAELEAAKAHAAEMEAIAADVERLRSECTAVEAARDEADAALSAMSAEADVLRGALAAGQEELAALRAVAAPLPSADTPARSRDHLKWEISSMGDELRAEERRRKLAEQRLASSDAALAEARSELEALREAGAHGQPPASYADAVSRGAGSATEAMEALAQREQDIVQLQNSLSHSDEQVRKLTAQIDELRATQSVETQAVKRQFEADCADLRAEAAEQLRTVSEDAARLQRALDSAATENEQVGGLAKGGDICGCVVSLCVWGLDKLLYLIMCAVAVGQSHCRCCTPCPDHMPCTLPLALSSCVAAPAAAYCGACSC